MTLFVLLLLLAATFGSSRPTSSPRQVDCAGTQRSVTSAQEDLLRIAFGGFQESRARFQARAWLNFEALIAFGNNAVDAAQLLYVLRTIEAQVDPANVTVAQVWSVAQNAFLQAAAWHETRYLALPRQLASREALQIAGLYTYATRFAADHFSVPSVRAAKAAEAWLQAALVSKCMPVTVGSDLAALWCPQGAAPQHAIVVNTGFDGSLFTLWTESGEAAFDAGYSVLVLMGPGQGET